MRISAVSKKQNNSDTLILVASTKSLRSRESMRANTENNDNKRDITPTRNRAIKHRRPQKNRKIVTESDSKESKRDKMSYRADNNTKEKKLGTSNSSIKVYIPYSLV